jgi:hypothetical protein
VPLFASAGVFAAVVLAVVVLGKLPTGSVGQATGSPHATVSFTPSFSVSASPAESSAPASSPQLLALGPGGIGYLGLSGEPLADSRLTFFDVVTGASIDMGTVSGPPIAAALSPDGKSLAYITEKGETGANEVWALNLTDGKTVPLGCSQAASFTDRLAWSADGSFLAFTLITVDLGPSSDCPADDGALGTADTWVYDAAHGERYRLTRSGNAYAASFMSGGNPATLLVSFAAESPWTEAVPLGGDPSNLDRIDGVFLPLLSPDGTRALFWSGTMAPSDGAGWDFSRGGLPQVSGDLRSADFASLWTGTPIFTDLTPVGGEAFGSGEFVWSPDSDQIAFWDGAWTGAPQSADGTYPSRLEVYAGRVTTGLLSSASKVPLGDEAVASIVDVALRPDGGVVVTVRRPSAGIGDPPSSYLVIASSDSVGVAVDLPRWVGPVIYGH